MLKWFRDKLEGCFAFPFSDLELCKRYEKDSQKRKKCRIISDELSQKLHQIYSKGKSGYIPPIKFIDLDLAEKKDQFEFLYFTVDYDEAHPFQRWIEVDEKSLREEAKVLHDGTLFIPFMKGVNENIKYDSKSLKFVLCWLHNLNTESFYETKAKETVQTRTSAIQAIRDAIKEVNTGFTSFFSPRLTDCLCCNDESGVNYQTHINKCLWRPDRINEFKNQQIALIKQTIPVRISAIQAIQNTIQNGNIDFTTLAESMLFLGESYISSRPSDCLYCNKELEENTKSIADFYQTHINKCLWRPDRINEFKDKQIALIKRIITKFNDYKKEAIQEVIEEAEEKGISEAELNNNRPNWQNTLLSLTNKEKIYEYFVNQLEEDIKRLVDAKSKSAAERQQAEAEARKKAQKEEERLKKEQEEKLKREQEEARKREAEAKKKQEQQEAKKRAEEKEKAKQQELFQKRSESITKIAIALDSEFPLTDSELSSQYQNWKEQINQLTDIQKIANLQDRLLADIQARQKDKKSAQELKENLNKTQTGTEEEKKQAWENLEKQETQKGYQENEEEIKKLKKEKATENPQKYSEETKRTIEEKLKSNEVKEEELSAENKKEWQKLKNGEIESPDQIVATENKIKQNIYQQEAVKKIVVLTSQVKEILKLKSITKSQIAQVKNELLKFISSGNIYHSTAQKKAVESLLAQLENHLVTNNNQNNSSVKPESFFGKIILPSLLIGTLLIAVAILGKKVIRARRQKHKVN